MPAADLRTVDRALTVLDLIASAEEADWGLTELGKRSGLSKATTLRMLGTLQKHGLVSRDGPDGRYRLGPRVLTLAGALRPRLRAIAHPFLHRLVEVTDETALLYLLDGTERVCADHAHPHQTIRVNYELGSRAPLHAGASGKVLLAFMSPQECRRLLSSLRLEAYTSTTITSEVDLERELAEIREQGYALSMGEHDSGVYGVSAPVFSGEGRLEAVATVAGPVARWRPERQQFFVDAVVKAARDMSYALGYVERSRVPAMAGGE